MLVLKYHKVRFINYFLQQFDMYKNNIVPIH